MRFGVHLRPTDETVDVRDLAPRVEALGFESLWVSEHSHIPVNTESQWPGGEGMPRFMARFLDPFLVLSRAAAVTETLMLGTGIVLAPQRDTIQLAKEVSTLDYLSGGRFLFGIGAGWNQEEMRNHGLDPPLRWRKMREQAIALRTIWTNETAVFHGELIQFDAIYMYPKPVSQPHTPILVGGEGPTVLDRVLEYGDGWIPNDHPELIDRTRELHRRARELDRPSPPVTAFAVEPDGQRIEELTAAGIDRCVFNLPSESASVSDVMAALEELAAFSTTSAT